MPKYRNYALRAAVLCAIILPFYFLVSAYRDSYGMIEKGIEYQPFLATKIFDVNGECISELFEENRNYVKINDIPDHVKKAFIAAEDENFYRHPGIDITGIIRAVAVNIFSGDIRQGGSTITQQLAKQLYTGGEKTIKRKAVELFISFALERKYRKDKILEMYLNQIYFGQGVYGIGSAAKFLFEKEVSGLSIPEAALLASIPSAPGKFSPFLNPELACRKSQHVIHNMAKTGFIDKTGVAAEFEDFWRRFLVDIKVKFQSVGVRNRKSDRAPYFTEYVRQILAKKFGEEEVYRGGYRIYTTLDLRCQKAADETLAGELAARNKLFAARNAFLSGLDELISEKHKTAAVRAGLKRFLNEFEERTADEALLGSLCIGTGPEGDMLGKYQEEFEKLKASAKIEGALVALNPLDGAITAMVGGSEFEEENQLNRALQARRQPGSSFKTFVYGAGIEAGKITPASMFLDAPLVFKEPTKVWNPSNYERSYHGKVSVRQGLRSSLNVVSVLIYELVGGNVIANFSSRLIDIPLKRFEIDPTLALGTTELTPLEMAQGYAVFANNGAGVAPYCIRYIEDSSGNRIFDGEEQVKSGKKNQIVSPETAFIVTSLLRDVVDRGTACHAVRVVSDFTLPAAGKTGTNSNFRDAWFVGYTPDLVAAVWVGCDYPKISLGAGQSGSAVAAPVWAKFMKEVYKFRQPKKFAGMPRGVITQGVCARTGKLPVKGCPVINEYFIAGTQPKQECNSDHDEMGEIFDFARKSKDKLKGDNIEKIEGILSEMDEKD